MATVQRRLSVIVCVNVVGYSRLLDTDEQGTLAALKAHREAVAPLFADEGGRVVKTTGNGLLLEFPSAFHAVCAGLAVQRLMFERNANVPESKRLVFRMGAHISDVIVDGDDIFGDGVNIAARLEALAEPGGMCISQAVHATIHRNIDTLFRDGGQKVLKNVAAPVHVYNLTVDGSTSAPATPATGALLSLVVLPFANLTGDARQDFLVDRVTDQLTSELARIEDSSVVNRNTALAYRGNTLAITELGSELGVRFVINGNVRASSGGLRVNVQLIEAEDSQPLWVDGFDIAIAQPFAMQHDVVVRLIPALHAQLLAASGRVPQPASAPIPEAEGNGSAGNVIHPRDVAQGVARTAPDTAEPRPALVVRRAAAPAPSPAPAPPPRRRYRIPFVGKVIAVALAGAVAVEMLGTQHQAVVAIVSWMLIAAGSVQMLALLVATRDD